MRCERRAWKLVSLCSIIPPSATSTKSSSYRHLSQPQQPSRCLRRCLGFQRWIRSSWSAIVGIALGFDNGSKSEFRTATPIIVSAVSSLSSWRPLFYRTELSTWRKSGIPRPKSSVTGGVMPVRRDLLQKDGVKGSCLGL